MSKRLLDIYRAILSTANMQVDPEGYVSQLLPAPDGQLTKTPATVKGKTLVLPTPQQLANPNWENRVAFHPMVENVMKDESEVLEAFRRSINARLNWVIGLLGIELLEIATSTSQHAKLKPEQHEFLSQVKNADEKTIAGLMRLITNAMPAKQVQKQFINIYLKKGGTLDGQQHARVAVVNFPLYHELQKGNDDIWGVQLRKKDLLTLTKLLEYIFPNIGSKDAYSRASDSKQAPFLDALMQAVMATAGAINTVVDRFGKHLTSHEILRYDDSWVEAFTNPGTLAAEARAIPMLAGNEGKITGSAAAEVAAAPLPQQPMQLSAPAAAPAQTMHAPVGGHRPAPAPVAFQPPVYQPPAQPNYAVAAYQQPQPAAVQRTASGTVEFQSVLRANPMLAQSVGAVPGMGMGMPGGAVPYSRDGPPRWAQPLTGGYGQPVGYGYGQATYGQTVGFQQPGFQQPGFQQPGFQQPGMMAQPMYGQARQPY